MSERVRVAVPATILDALRAISGAAEIGPSTATTAGYSNLSFFTTIDGREVVVKAALAEGKRADLRREARVLERLDALRDNDAPMPAVPGLVAHGDHGDTTINVLTPVAGEHGLAAVVAGDTDVVVARAAVLGRVLRSVHLLAPRPDPDPSSELVHRVAVLADELERVDLATEVRAEMRACLDAPVHRRGVAFVHGDFGFHNTLWVAGAHGGERLSALLDWEFAGWGNPLSDVAWFWWSLRFRGAAPAAWTSFADGYGIDALRAIGFDAASVELLIRAQMISLLLRTEPGSDVRDVWRQRWSELPGLGRASLS